jgi:hypothetical protein
VHPSVGVIVRGSWPSIPRRERGASETILVKEVDEIAALGALVDFCLIRKSRKLHMHVHIYTCIYMMRENRKVPLLVNWR